MVTFSITRVPYPKKENRVDFIITVRDGDAILHCILFYSLAGASRWTKEKYPKALLIPEPRSFSFG